MCQSFLTCARARSPRIIHPFFRHLQSGAKINISDGSCPERIVTVTGHTDSIYKAFKLICNKFEEVSAI